MGRLPTQFVDRWENRTEPGPGQGVVYWHMLMEGYPEVAEIAREAQLRLAHFSGLHMTPLEWLHMTALIVGPADEISGEQLAGMMRLASDELANIRPIRVTLGEILYYPEAIVLGVKPRRALDPILQAVRSATRAATGRKGTIQSSEGRTPHITLCYSTSQQPANAIITALGHQVPNREIDISTSSLVIQRGPERQWDWHPVGTVRLGSAL
jgi:2'-5' RNA ligase